MLMKFCEWCDQDFYATVKYQIYCSPECRTESTKQKNLLKQREKRVKSRVGKQRVCNTCGQPLSIYNDDTYCSTCIGDKKDLKRFLRNVK